MIEQLILLHFPAPALPGRAAVRAKGDWLEWNTCQRTLFIRLGEFPGKTPTFEGAVEYRGVEAYRFLLEVVSGLHSRLLGENEIVGQFKKRFLENAPAEYLILSNFILADVKRVRSQHSLNSGAHSYGSFCRKMLQGLSRVSLMGTGELAASLLPWIAQEGGLLQILHRTESSAQKLLVRDATQKWGGEIQMLPLSAKPLDLGGGLVIAAPLTAIEIGSLLDRASARPQMILDWRGESDADPLKCEIPVVRLSDFFNESRRVAESSALLRAQAMTTVFELAQAREWAIQIRTQGWEDLCG